MKWQLVRYAISNTGLSEPLLMCHNSHYCCIVFNQKQDTFHWACPPKETVLFEFNFSNLVRSRSLESIKIYSSKFICLPNPADIYQDFCDWLLTLVPVVEVGRQKAVVIVLCITMFI